MKTYKYSTNFGHQTMTIAECAQIAVTIMSGMQLTNKEHAAMEALKDYFNGN